MCPSLLRIGKVWVPPLHNFSLKKPLCVSMALLNCILAVLIISIGQNLNGPILKIARIYPTLISNVLPVTLLCDNCDINITKILRDENSKSEKKRGTPLPIWKSHQMQPSVKIPSLFWYFGTKRGNLLKRGTFSSLILQLYGSFVFHQEWTGWGWVNWDYMWWKKHN